jgi:hypothetical protein
MSERHEPQPTLETVDAFSAERIVLRRPAANFAVPASVVAYSSVHQLALILRLIPTFRDHR